MRRFSKLVEKHFSFLGCYGYICVQDNSEESVCFAGENNQIDIIFSAIGYELTCQFVDSAKNSFSLQDGLGYVEIKEFKGLYQIPSKEEIEKGIIYLADAVKSLFDKIDISDTMNFQRIYHYRLDVQKKMLEEYYFTIDIKKAEEFWKKGDYSKTQQLYERHLGSLSKVQRKRLEYIRKNDEKGK